jgi:hypothetical protein
MNGCNGGKTSGTGSTTLPILATYLAEVVSLSFARASVSEPVVAPSDSFELSFSLRLPVALYLRPQHLLPSDRNQNS